MTILSKFHGSCRACGKPIRQGEEIDYTKETGARHLACVPRDDDPLLYDSPAIGDIEAWLREHGWGTLHKQ